MDAIPEDIVRQCLLRMPYTSHDTLKTVCNSWEAMVRSPTFYADRKKCGTSEQLICLVQRDINNERDMNPVLAVTVYDPVNGTWQRLPPIDDPHNTEIPIWCQCVAVNQKLLLIGGFQPSTSSFTKSIYIYDFESGRWRCGADIPTARSFFACSVSSSTGLVYVAGGIDERGNPLAAAEAYDVVKDKWQILTPMIEPHGHGCRGVFVDGKFMVLREGQPAEVFDPSEGTWKMRAHWWNFVGEVWRSCVISSSSSELHLFTEYQVERYDVEKDIWSVVATLPNLHHLELFTCATLCGDQIFVSGVGERPRSNPEKHISYLFNMSTRQFIELHRDCGEEFAGMILHWWNFVGEVWRSCVISSSSSELHLFTEYQVERYDVEKDIWSVVATLPNLHHLELFTCATLCGDQIFVSGVGERPRSNPEKHISYLFNMSTRQFIELHRDCGEEFAGMILSAATVEI